MEIEQLFEVIVHNCDEFALCRLIVVNKTLNTLLVMHIDRICNANVHNELQMDSANGYDYELYIQMLPNTVHHGIQKHLSRRQQNLDESISFHISNKGVHLNRYVIDKTSADILKSEEYDDWTDKSHSKFYTIEYDNDLSIKSRKLAQFMDDLHLSVKYDKYDKYGSEYISFNELTPSNEYWIPEIRSYLADQLPQIEEVTKSVHNNNAQLNISIKIEFKNGEHIEWKRECNKEEHKWCELHPAQFPGFTLPPEYEEIRAQYFK